MSGVLLKPCPFCGGKALVDTYYSSSNMVTIKCDRFGAEITRMTSFGAGTAIDRVTEAWNSRADQMKV